MRAVVPAVSILAAACSLPLAGDAALPTAAPRRLVIDAHVWSSDPYSDDARTLLARRRLRVVVARAVDAPATTACDVPAVRAPGPACEVDDDWYDGPGEYVVRVVDGAGASATDDDPVASVFVDDDVIALDVALAVGMPRATDEPAGLAYVRMHRVRDGSAHARLVIDDAPDTVGLAVPWLADGPRFTLANTSDRASLWPAHGIPYFVVTQRFSDGRWESFPRPAPGLPCLAFYDEEMDRIAPGEAAEVPYAAPTVAPTLQTGFHRFAVDFFVERPPGRRPDVDDVMRVVVGVALPVAR